MEIGLTSTVCTPPSPWPSPGRERGPLDVALGFDDPVAGIVVEGPLGRADGDGGVRFVHRLVLRAEHLRGPAEVVYGGVGNQMQAVVGNGQAGRQGNARGEVLDVVILDSLDDGDGFGIVRVVGYPAQFVLGPNEILGSVEIFFAGGALHVAGAVLGNGNHGQVGDPARHLDAPGCQA